jgi:hypothetical protein
VTTLNPTKPTGTMAEALHDLNHRLVACQEAYDTYADGCSRRSTSDAMYEVRRNLAAVDRWLSGQNDEPIVFFAKAATQEGRDTYRIHYAADALVAAIHHILGAEYYAGLRTLEEVDPEDPWRYRDGKTNAEEERLRLAEGQVWVFPQSILGN